MRRAAPRQVGVALAAVAICVAAGSASVALAATGSPGDTTSTPTVTAPDAAPPPPAPTPDPGPVHLVPKPKPHVVHHTVSPAPVVVQPVYQAPVTPSVAVLPSRPAAKANTTKPRATPKHVGAKRKHLVKSKHRVTPKRVTKLKLQPVVPLRQTSARSGGGGWVNTAIVAGLVVLLLSVVLVATRRALRTTSGGETVSDVGLASTNGSHPTRHDEELLRTRPPPRTTSAVEIASDVGLASVNGTRLAPNDEEFLPLETLRRPPMRSHPQIPVAAERCVIGWWRGYVRSQFLASETGEAGDTILAESPPFAWRSNKPPPETGEAVAAYRQLLTTLSDLGWEAVEFGPAWYEVEFHRAAVVAPVST